MDRSYGKASRSIFQGELRAFVSVGVGLGETFAELALGIGVGMPPEMFTVGTWSESQRTQDYLRGN
jgi:hypothetical protein